MQSSLFAVDMFVIVHFVLIDNLTVLDHLDHSMDNVVTIFTRLSTISIKKVVPTGRVTGGYEPSVVCYEPLNRGLLNRLKDWLSNPPCGW